MSPAPSSPLGCSATGTMGMIADLTAGEIVEQLVHASSVARIRNIVFMVGGRDPAAACPHSCTRCTKCTCGMPGTGCTASAAAAAGPPGLWSDAATLWSPLQCRRRTEQHHRSGMTHPTCSTLHLKCLLSQGMGEPLNNYDAVKSAVTMMTDPRAFGLRRKKVTVSTVGVVPRLLQMADDMPGVRWARTVAPAPALLRLVLLGGVSHCGRLVLAVGAACRKGGGLLSQGGWALRCTCGRRACAARNAQAHMRCLAACRQFHACGHGLLPHSLHCHHSRPRRSLALSLHAPTQELRQTIVPSAKAFKLDRCGHRVERSAWACRHRCHSLSLQGLGLAVGQQAALAAPEQDAFAVWDVCFERDLNPERIGRGGPPPPPAG